MEKRERLETTLTGERADRVPVALWRHFPGDDQRAVDLAKAIIAFQNTWDFDFIKIVPSNTYSIVDYGVQEWWQGNLEGKRDIIKPLITRSLDWTELRRLDPTRGSLGQQAETIQYIDNYFSGKVPIILTIPSPLTQALHLAGEETLTRNMRTHTDRLKTGLGTLTDNLLRYIDSLRKLPLAGIALELETANYDFMSPIEYDMLGRPYDLKLLGALPSNWWLNIITITGKAPMLTELADYPVQVISWEDQDGITSLNKGKAIFSGTVCCGVGRWNSIHNGMPGEVRNQVQESIREAYGLRLIISTSSPLIITSPRSNIRMVRQVVEDMLI